MDPDLGILAAVCNSELNPAVGSKEPLPHLAALGQVWGIWRSVRSLGHRLYFFRILVLYSKDRSLDLEF